MKKILTEAAPVGDATARAITFRIRQTADYYYEKSAWRVPFLGQTVPGKAGTRRLYSPLEPWFKKTWRPGEIELRR